MNYFKTWGKPFKSISKSAEDKFIYWWYLQYAIVHGISRISLLSRNSKSKSRSFIPSQSLSKITIIPSKLFRHFMGALTKVSLIPGDWRCQTNKDKKYRISINFPSFFKQKTSLKQWNMQRKKYFYQNTKYKNCILFFLFLWHHPWESKRLYFWWCHLKTFIYQPAYGFWQT